MASIKGIEEAKDLLDRHIGKQRVSLYKPIQIAEILYRVRVGEMRINDITKRFDYYRKESKHWRDDISKKLIGQVSTSSARFQDDLFNAVPPKALELLAIENNKHDGVVERYIYQRFRERQSLVLQMNDLLSKTKPNDLRIEHLFSCFETEKKGIQRSIDKVYEIVSYSLFNTLIKHLGVVVTLEFENSQMPLLIEF
ncbi:MAG: HaeII family restriction endonuclease, partial [bacterium]